MFFCVLVRQKWYILIMKSRFSHDNIGVLTNSRVKEVQKDKVLFTQIEDGKAVLKEIPMGFCLWSTGVCE